MPKVKKMGDFIKKAFPDRKSKILAIGILVVLIGVIIFFAIQIFIPKKTKITADTLIRDFITSNLNQKNENIKIATIQKMDADINTSEGNASLNLENRRDKDTDHIMIDFKDTQKGSMEMYADKVDQQVGIYVKKSDNLWGFELKPKQSAVDDPRTEFIEVNASGSEIKLDDFKDYILEDSSDIENTYKVSSKIDGRVMLSLLGNNYQSIYINYDAIASYLAKYNETLTINCELYFNVSDKQLYEIKFTGTKDDFKTCNEASTGIQINSLNISLINESYENSNVYVPEDVEKITKTVKSLQTNRLSVIQNDNKSIIEKNEKNIEK